MEILELRDLDLARQFIVQGLWLQRVVPPAPARVRAILEWAHEVSSEGQPLPPLGFLADVGHAAFGQDRSATPATGTQEIPGLPPGLARTYEDHVLGKFY